MYQGTLRGNSHGLLVFTNLLAHADKEGRADIHPKAIAEEVGLTVDEVKAAIEMLATPDEDSRSPELDGRRITLLDEHRSWGWLVVNYVKYRSIRDEEDRREQNRISQERWRNRHKQNKPASADVSRDKPQSAHTEAEAEAEAVRDKHATHAPARPAVAAAPDCPHLEILKAWSETLPELPQHSPDLWKGVRADHLRARWRETAVKKGWQDQDSGLEYFRKLFGYLRGSPFLMGKVKPREGRRLFVAELEWLVKPESWAKVHEGKYHEDTV
jgi:hypothetical protein